MKDLTVGKEGRLIFYFAVPMLLGNVFQIINTITDRIIVGNYIGKDAVAAIGVSFPLLFALISLVIGITNGITIIISQYFGAKDYEKVKRSVDTAYIFLFFASILISAIGLLFCRPVFRLLDVPPDVMEDAIVYMQIIISGMIFMGGLNGTLAILRGLGDSKTPLYFFIVATVFSILTEIILVVYFHVGIQGAAIAAVIGQGVTFIASTWYLNKKHEMIKISFKRICFDRDIFMKSLKIGLPSGVQQFAVAIGMLFLIKLVDTHGTSTLAAYTIAGGIDSFAMLPAMNFSMALMTFVGQNMGAGLLHRVRKGLITTQVMTAIISVSVTLLVFLFPHSLMLMFNKDPEVIAVGCEYLAIVSPFYVLFSLMFINTGVFRGAGDTLIPMFLTIISLWLIRIPGAYILSGMMGTKGIWWSLPIAWFSGAIFSFIYYRMGNWRKKVIVKPMHIK